MIQGGGRKFLERGILYLRPILCHTNAITENHPPKGSYQANKPKIATQTEFCYVCVLQRALYAPQFQT